MDRLVKAGTDAACLCVFDAAALPADIDTSLGRDPEGVMERLQAEGRLWLHETGGDGTHLVRLIIDETALPAGLIGTPRTGVLTIPSGTLWVCGGEYLARDPRRGSAQTPKGGLGRSAMGAPIKVEPGRYDLVVLRSSSSSPSRAAGRNPADRLSSIAAVLAIIGGLIALVSTLVGLILLGQALYGHLGGAADPLPWDRLVPFPVGVLAGTALLWLGVWVGRRADRARAESESDGTVEPDLILRLTRAGDAS